MKLTKWHKPGTHKVSITNEKRLTNTNKFPKIGHERTTYDSYIENQLKEKASGRPLPVCSNQWNSI